MPRRRDLRPDEKALWKKVAKTVAPISPDRLVKMDDPSPASAEGTAKPSKPAKRGATALPATKVKKGPTAPVDRSGERKLRRGRVEIGARIDLHGMTQVQARSALIRFLHSARRRELKTVLVITGKGAMTPPREAEPWEFLEDPGVLRRRLPEWLSGPELRHLVSGFSLAHQRHGGSGAFYVTMRRGKK
jgi:DNA-nicking Smr family endonuclease